MKRLKYRGSLSATNLTSEQNACAGSAAGEPPETVGSLKTPVFGLLKRDGKIHVEIVKNCSKEQLMPIIKGQVLEGSTVHTDGWAAYDGLVLNGYDHYRVYHSHDEFARGKCHVNGVEAFWSFAKRRLSKFNGIAGHTFYLHLKECEFRFNYSENELSSIIWEKYKKYTRC